MTNITPVLIVGAGPVGLMAACELKKHDIECRIIDKKDKATQTSNSLAIHSRSLEMWNDLGIAEKAISLGCKIEGIELFVNSTKLMVDICYKKILRDYNYPFALSIPQSVVEQLLEEKLNAFGTTVERSTKLIHIQPGEKHSLVTVELESGAQEKLTCAWVLACDGYHSTIRELLDIPYKGEDMEHRFIMMDTAIDWNFKSNKVRVFPHNLGTSSVIPMPGGYRIFVETSKDKGFSLEDTLTRETFISLLERRYNWSFNLRDETFISKFYIHERLSERYRQGNIFLLGDAAHVHSPAGGQGLNTGMQDAYNLAWKLAFLIKGYMNNSLLDSYQKERQPIADKVLASSNKLTNLATARTKWAVTLRNIRLNVLNKSQYLQSRFVKQITGLNYQYHNPAFSFTSLLRTKYIAGSRTPTIFKGTRFVLLISEQHRQKEVIRDFINSKYSAIIDIQVVQENDKHHNIYQLNRSYCLIRPDQYVACRGKSLKQLLKCLRVYQMIV